MKYVGAFIAGLIAGAILFVLLVYFNPLIRVKTVSPITATDSSRFELVYSATPTESILWTESGSSNVEARPPMVKNLSEPAIQDTKLFVSLLQNSRGKVIGVGVKYETVAEETGFLNGIYPVNSTWHIWLLQRGGLMIDQKENHWLLYRDVVLPARMASSDSWRGTWQGIITIGPKITGVARIVGGSGNLAGLGGDAVESIGARAYSAETGPIAMVGRLSIALTDEN